MDTDSSGTLNTGDTGITKYEYDYRNRLTKVSDFTTYANYNTNTSTQTVEYTYDYLDRRILKKLDADGSGENAADYLYNVYQGDNAALEIHDADGLATSGTGENAPHRQHRYLYGSAVDEILASEDAAAPGNTSGNVLWGLGDHEGTIRDIVQNDRTVVDHRKFDAFGKMTSESTPATDFIFGYTGQALDKATNLYDYGHRWYDASVGRFATEDPSGFSAGDMNLYRYVGNNPLNYTDPTGLSWLSEFSKTFNRAAQDVGHMIERNSKTIQDVAMGAQIAIGALTFNPLMVAAGSTALYESLSGSTIGDGTLTRVLGASSIIVGGFSGGGFSTGNYMIDTTAELSRFGLTGVSAYETMSGDRVLGGTLSTALYGTYLATGTLPMATSSSLTMGSRMIAGAQVGLGATSIAAGDSELGRSVNIAGSLWASAQSIQDTLHYVQNTLQPTVRGQSPDNYQSGVIGASYEEGMFDQKTLDSWSAVIQDPGPRQTEFGKMLEHITSPANRSRLVDAIGAANDAWTLPILGNQCYRWTNDARERILALDPLSYRNSDYEIVHADWSLPPGGQSVHLIRREHRIRCWVQAKLIIHAIYVYLYHPVPC